MKKRLLLLALILALLLCACQSERDAKKIRPITAETRYIVGVRSEGFETVGTVFLGESGECHFLHSDPTSPLFGMEEIRGENTLTIQYHDICWEGRFANTVASKACDVMRMLYQGKLEYAGRVRENELDLLHFTLENENFQIQAYFNEKNGQIKKVLCHNADTDLSLTFSDVEAKSPIKTSSV